MEGTVENNPLILIYRTLGKADGRRLGKWLDSPYHNQREDVKHLHAYLLGGKDRLVRTNSLSKTRIWKQLFPTKTYDDARLRQTFHWTLRATEAFLAYESWQRNPTASQFALISELQQRNIAGVAARSIKKTEQIQARVPLKNENFYRDQYKLELAKDEYRIHYQLLEQPRFQEIADTLDLTYFIEKLKASGNMLFHQRLYKAEFKLDFLDEVVARVAQYDLTAYPVLAIHYYGYLGLTEDDERGEIIGLLRDAVARHGDMLSQTDLRYIILMAINLCISNMNRGRDLFIRESLEWYKIGLQNDAIADNNLLTRETYLNVVSIALKLDEFDWVADFITKYSDLLEVSIRKTTEDFAKARLAYKQKQYDVAMPLLVTVDFKHHVYNLIAKTLLLKIYHELDEFDALDSQLDSMTTYIRRKQLSDLHRAHFGNIVRFVRQLSRIAPGDREKLADLRQRVEASSPLAEKKWLLEQIDAR